MRGGQVLQYLSVASDGTFTDPNFAPSASESIVAEVTGNGVENSQSAPVALTVTNSKPTLKLKVNSVTVTYGKSVTVTGTVTYPSGSTAEPLAGLGIWIAPQEQDLSTVATGTTGADGSFSITLPAQQSGTTLYVGTTGEPGLTQVVTPLRVNVVRPTVISGLKVSLNQYWKLSVSGCLGFVTGDTSVGYFNGSGLTVQYADSTRGPWKKLFAISGTSPAVSAASGSPARTSRRRTTPTTGSSTPEPRARPASPRRQAEPSLAGGTTTGSPASRCLLPPSTPAAS